MKPQRFKLNKLYWEFRMEEKQTRLLEFIPSASIKPSGMSLIRPARDQLNRLRTSVEHFRSNMHK